MKIKAKILQFGQKYGMSGSEIAQRIGCARSSFTGEAMNNGLNSDSVQRFLKMFPEVSAEWLMRDEGPMLRTGVSIGEQNINNGVNLGKIGSDHTTDGADEQPIGQKTDKESPCLTCGKTDCIFLKAKQEVIDAQKITIEALRNR